MSTPTTLWGPGLTEAPLHTPQGCPDAQKGSVTGSCETPQIRFTLKKRKLTPLMSHRGRSGEWSLPFSSPPRLSGGRGTGAEEGFGWKEGGPAGAWDAGGHTGIRQRSGSRCAAVFFLHSLLPIPAFSLGSRIGPSRRPDALAGICRGERRRQEPPDRPSHGRAHQREPSRRTRSSAPAARPPARGRGLRRASDAPASVPASARVPRASPWGGRAAVARRPHEAPRPGAEARARAERGVAGRGARARPGRGCRMSPPAHTSAGGRGSEPLRCGDLLGPRAEQEVSQGREPEGFGLSFPPRPAGSRGGQACAARQLGRGAAVPPFALTSSLPSGAEVFCRSRRRGLG